MPKKKGKKGNIETLIPCKLTGQGESVKLLLNEDLQQRKSEEMMRNDIDDIISQAEPLNQLDTITFQFIHVHYFYTKISIDSKNDYIPAEFTVVEFSLKNGVKRLYHRIIRTEIELGYFREYMETSDNTHKLNNNLPEGSNDYKEMCMGLINFLNHGNKSKKLPPLYTSFNLKTIVPCLFKRMTEAADLPEDTFKLYSLGYLLGSYIKYIDLDLPPFANLEYLGDQELLKRDMFEGATKIACPYHSTIGAESHCSQSIVHQWVYTFCNICCPQLNISMIRGIHCPEKTSLSKDMQSLSIRADKPSTILSATGVSDAYRQARSVRSRAEDERRKNASGNLTIVDHSKLSNNESTIPVKKATDASVKEYKSKCKPETMSAILANHKEVPKFNNQEFPDIGSGFSRRGKRRNH